MNPIQERGSGDGVGYKLTYFLAHFESICAEHQRKKCAKAFAIIFYNFQDKEFKKILRNRGVFAQLDRLSGKNLSIFCLRTGSKDYFRRFNSAFLSKLELKEKAKPPCVVFFRLSKDVFKDVAVVQLCSADLVNGFHELYGVIEHYVTSDLRHVGSGLRYIKWIRSAVKFIGPEVIKAAIRNLLGHAVLIQAGAKP
jgi:hypothetical protein